MRGSMRQITSRIVVLGGMACLCALFAVPVGAFPLNLGTYDEEKMGKHKEAEELLQDLNLQLNVDSNDVVRIGSGYTVAPEETVEGDVVIIGGGLTVKGTIQGDAVVVGGSMYLEDSAVVGGDAAVVGGILEMEDGATVKGQVIEDVDMQGRLAEASKKSKEAMKEQEEALKQLENLKGLEGLEGLKNLEGLKELEDLETQIEEDEGDLVKFGKDIHIAEGEMVDGDVVAIGGDITVDGHVTGDVVTTAGDIYISSTAHVEGDVTATFGKVTVEPGAETDGDVAEVSMGGVKTIPQFKAGTGGGEESVTYLVSLYAPDADDVRLTGDFMDWDPEGIEMKEEDGTWKTQISLGPGSYMYKFIVDGEWMADPETPEKVPDGMGGYATPLIVKGKKAGTEDITTHIFSLDRPEAGEIRISASWSDWNPDEGKMTRDEDGVWSTRVALPPGLHAYMFCVDGKCIADPDEPDLAVTDRYGRRVTTVIVKPRQPGVAFYKFWNYRPDAVDMRLTGTWNDWDPDGIPMYLDHEGNWFTYVALAAGTYKYKFYIDGEWVPDPDVEETVPDGRGGQATKFTVVPPKPPKKLRTLTVKAGGEMKEKGFSFSPAIDYNRVDGIYLAAIAKYGSTAFPEPNFYLEGGYSKMRDRGLYKFEIEQPIFKPLDLWVGGSIYDLTATEDKEIITDLENILVAGLFKFDYRDYYDLRGVSGFARLSPMKGHTLKITYSGDEYRPLKTKANAALFRGNKHFAPNPRNMIQICNDPEWNDERICSRIKNKALKFEYEYDTRNCEDTPTMGTWMRLSGEFASTDWGGDLGYSRYMADLRRYLRISSKQQIGLKLKAGMVDVPDEEATCRCVPDPQYFFPREFYVGGIGTLPAYGYKEFRGTHMLLANLEYNYLLKDEMGIVFFSDAGDARGEEAALKGTWDADEVWEEMKIRFDAGVALRFEAMCDHTLTLGIAQRLDDLDRGAVFTVRASRMF
jgi:cytoskeletal protein CcmA (bactofilin family)